jgi:hypothetical protein
MSNKNHLFWMAVLLLLSPLAQPLFAAGAAEEGGELPPITDLAARACIDCHGTETPNIVADWRLSRHARNSVDCSVCHGDAHRSAADANLALIPTPDTCAMCHPDRVTQFKSGKHAAAWAAMKAMPTIHSMPATPAIPSRSRKPGSPRPARPAIWVSTTRSGRCIRHQSMGCAIC